jgi:hypothetical protein
MKLLSPTALLASLHLAQAAYNFTGPSGFTYSLTKTQHGVEVPITSPPTPLNKTKPAFEAAAKRDLQRGGKKNRRQSVTYNWCGLVQTSPPSGQVWSEINGAWTIPVLTLRSGQSYTTTPGIDQWVGLDGGCGSQVLVQGGTGSDLNHATGLQESYAWFWWFPAEGWNLDFSGMHASHSAIVIGARLTA